MANDKIGIDQIEARLGKLNAPKRSYDSDYEPIDNVQRPPRLDEGDDDDGSGVIFYASVVGAFVAVMLGTVWLGGGKISNPFGQDTSYVSTVAATCDKGWKTARDNRDQIDCWFKSNTSRLCKEEERAALVRRISDYSNAAELGHASEMGAVFAMAGNVGGAMRIGLEDAMSHNSNSDSESEAHTEAAMQAAQDYMAPATEAIAVNANTVSEYQMQKDFRSLVKSGYITKGDFGWGPPLWIQQTFEIEPGQDKPRCNS